MTESAECEANIAIYSNIYAIGVMLKRKRNTLYKMKRSINEINITKNNIKNK